MESHIQSILSFGTEALIVEVECHLSNGLPGIIIVGLGNKAVAESKERIRSAFASSGLALPRKRITINLAPADTPKDSTSLDLAIAIAILQTNTPALRLNKTQACIGEIGLDGTIRPVRGIIGTLLAGQKSGITSFLISKGNLEQAKLVPGINLTPLTTIADLVNYNASLSAPFQQPAALPHYEPIHDITLSAIAGQLQAKRALEIAAAGGHNIFLHGPPGTGKSMLAKALPSILPPPSYPEILEITHLHSLASQNYDELITTRPFRSPHNSASFAAILGGGDGRLPGEVALSHRGVLFLDELPEFSRITLEALRQPLEDKCITISRARHTIRYPTHFILAATANPCPCGYYGSAKECSCTAWQIIQYQRKISGPIMDRIDLHVAVDTVDFKELINVTIDPKQDQEVRQRVIAARKLQSQRSGGQGLTNSELSGTQLKRSAKLEPQALELLNTAAERLDISARSYVKLVRVARTIADLDHSSTVTSVHVSEALQYRHVSQKP